MRKEFGSSNKAAKCRIRKDSLKAWSDGGVHGCHLIKLKIFSKSSKLK